MSDEELYQQYLAEQEAAKQPESQADRLARIRAWGESYMTPEKIEGAVSLGLGAGPIASSLGKAIPALGRGVGKMIAPYLEGGSVNAAQAPEGDRLKSFLKGGVVQGGMHSAGSLLGKAGDVAMQLAVGRKKFTPGVGTKLAEEGLIGTRGMMKDQAKAKMMDSYEKMLHAAERANPIDAREIGQAIKYEAAAPITGHGTLMPSTRDAPAIETINEFSKDVMGRGQESAIQALARRRAAGASAYSMKSGEPKQNQVSQLSKMEQRKYSEALKKSDPSGELAEADASYGALKRAERGLEEEPSLTGLGVLSRPLSTVGGALPTSIVGQAAAKSDPLAKFLAPIARQSFVAPSTEDNEEALYQQYLKEKGR